MKRKLLLVEDDPTAIRITKLALEKAGYELLVAANGPEGLNKAREERPDLVILDVMLPGLDGFQVCQDLRAHAQTSEIPILMLSAKAQKSDTDTGLKVGADDYLAKPALPSVLVDRIEKLLAKKTIESV